MLKSTKGLHGYKLVATDGEIGHVQDFHFDDRSWAIRRVVAETGHWYAGQAIQVGTGKFERVSRPEAKLLVKLTQADIQETAKATPATAGPAKQTAGHFID